MRYSASAGLIRRLNRSAILDLVREQGPIARSAIGRQLNISLPTVMRIIDDLIEVELVKDCGDTEASGGRPRSLLEFNASASAVVGIDLGGTKMFGTVADLGGNVQEEVYVSWGEDGSNDNLKQLYHLIDRLLAAPRPAGQRIRGIGVGAPGITRYEEGIVSWAPSLKWRDLPLKRILTERYGLPVFVENDVNLAALGEYGFGTAKGAASLVCLAIGTGIGAGIVIDRKIYRGHKQSAGEIGYLPPDVSFLGRHYAGFGALESIASDMVLGLFPISNYRKWDMVEFDDHNNLKSIIIKQDRPDLKFGWTNVVWKPGFTEFMHKYLKDFIKKYPDGMLRFKKYPIRELYVGDIIQAAINEGMKVDHLIFEKGSSIDLGTPDDLKNYLKSQLK